MSSLPTSLRIEINARRESDDQFNMRAVVAMMVPFITELAERHDNGESMFVHPSAIAYEPSGAYLIPEEAAEMPEDQRDRACLAPEQRQGAAGGTCASVFAIGAVLYELVTGETVGPGMQRPSDMVQGIPEGFEQLLGKALISDIDARPQDLGALAQALHQCSPMASIPPPNVNAAAFDDDDFAVDVSMSLLPPAPGGGGGGGPAVVNIIPTAPALGGIASLAGGIDSSPGPAPSAPHSAPASSTEMLTQLKARLESDPRPRYVVIKAGMDHGPFTAVELLQQIATGSFRDEHYLRDILSKDERQIATWDEFAPFAEHAGLGRAATTEKKALEAKVVDEQVKTQNTALLAGGALVLIFAAGGGWWWRASQGDAVRIGVSGDQAQSIDYEEGLKGSKKGGGYKGGGKWSPGSGDSDSNSSAVRPVVAGGGSCAAARNAYVLEYGNNNDTPPDLTAGAYGAVLNRGTYLNSCGVPPTMSVSICAAVQNGHAVGVTVSTKPANGGISSCIRGQIFGMGFPSHPRLDVSTTVFKGE
jgi:hypothetical protein